MFFPGVGMFKSYASVSRDLSTETYGFYREELQRPNTHFKLGELDDIGGCRLIVETSVNTP